MKTRAFLITFILIITAAAIPLTAEDFLIDHYKVDIDVLENNVYEITETLSLNFTSPRHGIVREIPLWFDDRPIYISDINVKEYEFNVLEGMDSTEIWIGSEEKYIEGAVIYRISYSYDVGADELPNMDEFNHNIIGNMWDTTIAEVEFIVKMPKAFTPDYVNCSAGPYGSTDSSKVKWQVRGNTITGKTTGPLKNYEGLTVSLPLPEGYWVGAKPHRKKGWAVFRVLGFPLYGGLFLLSFILWLTRGRDKKLKPVLQGRPPGGLNPAEIGYIINGSVDSSDVTALILYWADKGHLEIEEEATVEGRKKEEHLILTKVRELGKDARPYEILLFKKLFEEGDGTRVSTENLTNKFHITMHEVMKSVKKSLSENREKAIYQKNNKFYMLLTGLFAALPIIAGLIEGFLFFSNDWGMALIFGLAFSSFIIIPGIFFTSALAKLGTGGKAKTVFFLGLVELIIIAFMGIFSLTGGMSLYKYLASVLSGLAIFTLMHQMKRRTAYGQEMLEKILGFKMYIKAGEKERKAMGSEANPAWFYRYLSFAMAMNMSDKWAEHFKGIAVEPPQWYSGLGLQGFELRDFSNRLNHNMSTLDGAMTSSPSSSTSGSSSSGGFSGGGSGGGGGGSW